jgi:hypothetical protein
VSQKQSQSVIFKTMAAVSLWDMLTTFPVVDVYWLSRELLRAADEYGSIVGWNAQAEALVGFAGPLCLSLGMDRVAMAPIYAVRAGLKNFGLFGDYGDHDVRRELKTLQRNIEIVLSERIFVYVGESETEEFLRWEKTWKRVIDHFSEAKYDIGEAVTCFAIRSYTATVFHMMRVAECGLRTLTNTLGVTLKHDIEVEDWRTILEEVDKKIEKLQNSPRSLGRESELKIYCDAASHIGYLKVWRNDIAHARCTYNEGDARSSMMRVLALLEPMCPVTASSAGESGAD